MLGNHGEMSNRMINTATGRFIILRMPPPCIATSSNHTVPYMNMPIKNVTASPQLVEMLNARGTAKAMKAAFTAKSIAATDPETSILPDLSTYGSGIPVKKPRGAIETTTRITLTGKDSCAASEKNAGAR